MFSITGVKSTIPYIYRIINDEMRMLRMGSEVK